MAVDALKGTWYGDRTCRTRRVCPSWCVRAAKYSRGVKKWVFSEGEQEKARKGQASGAHDRSISWELGARPVSVPIRPDLQPDHPGRLGQLPELNRQRYQRGLGMGLVGQLAQLIQALKCVMWISSQ